MKKNKSFRNKIIAAVTCMTALLAAAAPVQVFAAYIEHVEIPLESGAVKGPGFISSNDTFYVGDKPYGLILCGLKEENKTAVLEALSENFNPDDPHPIDLVDIAFPDAEKYDLVSVDYDSAHCWAGSVSNMLWMTGWADGLYDPHTGADFTSEDDIFQYYNVKITNYGCDHIASAIDWFFMGEFYDPPYVNHTATLIPEEISPEDGAIKSFVSTGMQTHYDLIKDARQISQLFCCDWSQEGAGVFEAGIGTIDSDEEPYKATHSVTAVGLIVDYDPEVRSLEEQVKAIVLLDSDNSASPALDGEAPSDPSLAYKEEKKKERPNIMTVYKLRYQISPSGIPTWLITGYGAASTTFPQEWAICYLNKLPMYSETLLAEGTEPPDAGTMNINENLDFTMDFPFTTDREYPLRDLERFDPDEETVSEFVSGNPIRVNCFIVNRSNVFLDESTRQGCDLAVDWSVIRDMDQTTAASGRYIFNDDMPNNAENGFLIDLNRNGDAYEAWEPGTYTVHLDLNKDRNITEAYYLNNIHQELHFTVTKRPTVNISKAKATLSKTSYTYSGTAKRPGVTVTYKGKTLERNVDYKVKYDAGRTNVGTYNVEITGIGNFSGSKTKSFKINPKGTKLVSLKSAKNGFTVSWASQTQKMSASRITGYQIQYSRSSTFETGNKKAAVKGYRNTSKKINELKAGKKYYVRIRTYKTVDGKTYYSAWSGKRSVTPKAK